MRNSEISAQHLRINDYGDKTTTFHVGTMEVFTTFELAEGATVSFEASRSTLSSQVDINCGLTLSDGSKIEVEDGVKLTLAQGATLGAGGLLSLNRGSCLVLKGGLLDVSPGSLSVVKGSVIELALGAATLNLGGTLENVEDLLLAVTGSPGTYRLFAQNAVLAGFGLENIDFSGVDTGNREIETSYDEQTGELTISTMAYDLVWNSGDMTWSEHAPDVLWDTTDVAEGVSSFVRGDRVTYNGASVEGNVEVTVEGSVSAGKMTVLTDADTDYSFVGDAISVSGALSVSGGGQVVFKGAGISVAEGTTVSGGTTLVLAGTGAGKALGDVVVEAGSEVLVTATTGWAHNDSQHSRVSGSGRLVYDGLVCPFLVGRDSQPADGRNLLYSTVYAADSGKAQAELTLRNSDFGVWTGEMSRIQSVPRIVVEDGSSIGMGTNSLNAVTTEHSLCLSGAGYAGKGALYVDSDADIGWQVELAGDALVSNVGRYHVTNPNQKEARRLLLKGELKTNGYMLSLIDGSAGDDSKRTALYDTFTMADEDKKGGIEVAAGTLCMEFNKKDTLSGYQMRMGYNTTLVMKGDTAEGRTYTIGSLSSAGGGFGSVQLGSGSSGKLIMVNAFSSCVAENTYSGTLAYGIEIEVAGGYQAIHSTLTNDTVMSVHSGATLDLNGIADLVTGEDEEEVYGARLTNDKTLELTVGTAATEPTEQDDDALPGTAGHLLMQSIEILARAQVRISSLGTQQEQSTVDMSRASFGPSALLELNAARTAVTMDELTSDEGLTLSLSLQDNCSASMAQASVAGNSAVTLSLQTSTLSAGGFCLGANSTLDAVLAGASSADLSAASFGEAVKVSILAQGGAVSLAGAEFANGTGLSISAAGTDVSLAGSRFDMVELPEPEEGEENAPMRGADVVLDLAGGSHDFSNMTFSQDATFELTLKDDAHALFTGTKPASGLHLTALGSKVVLENLQMDVNTRISAEDGTLTFAGQNSILLDSQMMSDSNPRIFGLGLQTLRLQEGSTLYVDITSVLPDILEEAERTCTYYIAYDDVTAWRSVLSFGAELALLHVHAELGEDGSLSFTSLGVDDNTVYWATRDNVGASKSYWNAGTDVYASADSYVAVYVDADTRIDLRNGDPGYRVDGLVLSNLIGASGANLIINGDGSGVSRVTISNNLSETGLMDLEDVVGVHISPVLTFEGNISVEGADVQIKHRDADKGAASADSLTRMKGVFTVSDGELQMTSGRLELSAAGNAFLGGVSFAGNDGQIIVQEDAALGGYVHMNGAGETGTERTEHILLENSSSIVYLHDGVHVGAGVTIGNNFAAAADAEEPADEPSLGEDTADEPAPVELIAGVVSAKKGSQTMEVGSRLAHVVLNLEAGSHVELTAAPEPEIALAAELAEETPAADWQLAGLTGEGSLSSTAAHEMDICVAVPGGASFSGDLSGYNGTMNVWAGSQTQYFDGVTGGSGWNLTNNEGGRVVLDLMGKGQNKLVMGELTLKSGSDTTILLDFERISTADVLLSLQKLTVEEEAVVTLGQYEGTVSLKGMDGKVTTTLLGIVSVPDENTDLTISEDAIWRIIGIRNASDVHLWVDSTGHLYMDATIDNSNYFAEYSNNENSTTGAGLMWGVRNSYQLGGDLAALDSLLYGLLMDKEPTSSQIAEANRTMAAVAGSSIAVLSEAASSDMQRQLRSIRNRTTSLSYGGDSYSRLHSSMWVNAESNFHKQKADGMMPGYKLNGWGGTVGAHTQVGGAATVGLALTAMYSDVESRGADSLKGDMDAYYLSAFAQVAHDAWRHTFVLSVGKTEVDATRTVSFEGGGYSAKDSTDGLGLGVFYEMGYTMPLNVDYSVCLQPVFNVEWRLNQLGAFRESSSSNAALSVEEQTYSAVTLGLGARLQAAVGANVWNRTGIFEARALLKADVGDREGKATVALQKFGAYRGSVKSAEKGFVGVELGAGITLPTGRRGEVFVDGSAELRADYTNFNAAVGYKISF